MKKVYFDNAATSYPKPEAVYNSVISFLKNSCANPGRSAHSLSIESSKIVFSCRELIKELINAKNSENIIFTSNATEALNLAILGFLKKDSLVLTTQLEHNSVMRPLNFLKKSRNIKILKIEHNKQGKIIKEDFIEKIKNKPELVVVNHASNVTGIIQDIDFLKEYKKKYGYKILIDTSQSLGTVNIDVRETDIDFLAFTGHKSLYGLQGIGGLYLKDKDSIVPIKFGGTGSLSEKEEQPDFLPDKFESGTLNCPAIAGLKEGVNFILQKGIKSIKEHKAKLVEYFVEKLREIEKLEIFYGDSYINNAGVVSIKSEKVSTSQIAMILDRKFGICVRPGLHCSPSTHKFLNTYPQGTVRFSFSIFNNLDEIDYAANALKEIL